MPQPAGTPTGSGVRFKASSRMLPSDTSNTTISRQAYVAHHQASNGSLPRSHGARRSSRHGRRRAHQAEAVPEAASGAANMYSSMLVNMGQGILRSSSALSSHSGEPELAPAHHGEATRKLLHSVKSRHAMRPTSRATGKARGGSSSPSRSRSSSSSSSWSSGDSAHTAKTATGRALLRGVGRKATFRSARTCTTAGRTVRSGSDEGSTSDDSNIAPASNATRYSDSLASGFSFASDELQDIADSLNMVELNQPLGAGIGSIQQLRQKFQGIGLLPTIPPARLLYEYAWRNYWAWVAQPMASTWRGAARSHAGKETSQPSPAQPEGLEYQPSWCARLDPRHARIVLYQLFSEPSSSKAAWALSVVIMLTITLSAAFFIVESLPQFRVRAEVYDDPHPAFVAMETIAVVIFTLEYLVRLLCVSAVPSESEQLLMVDDALRMGVLVQSARCVAAHKRNTAQRRATALTAEARRRAATVAHIEQSRKLLVPAGQDGMVRLSMDARVAPSPAPRKPSLTEDAAVPGHTSSGSCGATRLAEHVKRVDMPANPGTINPLDVGSVDRRASSSRTEEVEARSRSCSPAAHLADAGAVVTGHEEMILRAASTERPVSLNELLVTAASVRPASSPCQAPPPTLGRHHCTCIAPGTPGKLWRFFMSPANIIDVLSVLPWYLELLLSPSQAASSLTLLRVLRLGRIIRIFKLSKYSTGVLLMGRVIRRSAPTLALLMFFFSMALLMLGSIVFVAESGDYDPSTGQYMRYDGLTGQREPTPFTSIFVALWYAIVTATSTGYGDMVATSLAGRLAATALMVIGVLVLALPITVFSAMFASEYGKPDTQREDNVPWTECEEPLVQLSLAVSGKYLWTPEEFDSVVVLAREAGILGLDDDPVQVLQLEQQRQQVVLSLLRKAGVQVDAPSGRHAPAKAGGFMHLPGIAGSPALTAKASPPVLLELAPLDDQPEAATPGVHVHGSDNTPISNSDDRVDLVAQAAAGQLQSPAGISPAGSASTTGHDQVQATGMVTGVLKLAARSRSRLRSSTAARPSGGVTLAVSQRSITPHAVADDVSDSASASLGTGRVPARRTGGPRQSIAFRREGPTRLRAGTTEPTAGDATKSSLAEYLQAQTANTTLVDAINAKEASSPAARRSQARDPSGGAPPGPPAGSPAAAAAVGADGDTSGAEGDTEAVRTRAPRFQSISKAVRNVARIRLASGAEGDEPDTAALHSEVKALRAENRLLLEKHRSMEAQQTTMLALMQKMYSLQREQASPRDRRRSTRLSSAQASVHTAELPAELTETTVLPQPAGLARSSPPVRMSDIARNSSCTELDQLLADVDATELAAARVGSSAQLGASSLGADATPASKRASS